MKVINFNDECKIQDELIVTIGQFDGLHLGHMELINTVLKEKKDNLKTCLITFNPHIDSVLFNKSKNDVLLTLDNQINFLEKLGFDYLLIINFNKTISNISYQDFHKKYLQSLNIYKLVVGFDFSYGNKGLGNAKTLESLYHDKLIVVSKKEIDNLKIGSFQIKSLIKNYDFETANKLLGYDFFLTGDIKDSFFQCPNIEILPKNKYIVLINDKEYLLDTSNNSINSIDQNNIKLIIKSKA